MKKTLFAAVAALGLMASSAQAADTFVFQWLDEEPGLTGNTYMNGELIQSVLAGNEQYGGGYGLWSGATLVENVDVAVNILEGDGSISDTWHIFGTAGDSYLSIPFFSDAEDSFLQALEGGFSLYENGEFQTVAEFDVSNGDHYVWQFRSDVEAVAGVPEPSTWAMMLLGFGFIGASMRVARRKSVATA